ncbi:MAG TPA: DUF5985 family protein [Polyangia bacterium]|jgi:hypothetical protein
MNDFLWGAIAVTSLAIGLRFLRFWRASHERLFAFFAFAFWLFGLQFILLEVFHPPTESRYYFYLFRLAAFLLIIAGIIDKNLAKKRA